MNALIEQSSKIYRRRMEEWIDTALEEGVRFFVTSLGKPDWVVRRVERVGGCVYHDVTERKWAQKGVDSGVRGLIAVNSRAGGHPGPLDARALLDDVSDLGLPVVCAGGVGNEEGFIAALRMGYAGVQMGTRFIATDECTASAEYKQAIADTEEEDIVHSERLTGVPVAVINTPSIQRLGLRAGPLARWMLRGRRTKHWMRTIYALKSLRQLRRSLHATSVGADYWQAGKSVSGIRGRGAGRLDCSSLHRSSALRRTHSHRHEESLTVSSRMARADREASPYMGQTRFPSFSVSFMFSE